MGGKLPKVVKVLDAYTVVLNQGARDGLSLGDKFLVYGVGDEIVDPDTGDNLGAIELVRGRVKVTHLQERLATARTATTITIPGRKRRIERDPFSFALRGAVEEIQESASVEDEPLNDPEVNDLARPA